MVKQPLVVASIPIRNVKDLEIALSIKDADYVELRLDYYSSPERIDYTMFANGRFIATLREKSEGGVNSFDPNVKKSLIMLWRKLGILYDVEASFIEKYNVEYNNAIVSIHILSEPKNIIEVENKVIKYLDKAFAVKIAVVPFKGYKSFLAKLLELGENVAVMPMNVEPRERIAFALLGSKLVYGYVTEPTANGQMHYKKIREVLNLFENTN
ncbi:type I 3-dehydroquinate dehydratase [Ignisphaera sp. 4213-co]|uniref:3-dehydroquinate dehydratase n=1 Tax=Ignisphaera cupida TaxID=3050454 RepID=A0ABD4Z7J4_9CREN|nr:type I 3-dehydroquinate dehydratase [Ignisphaera sp. 4213-co]MDK6028088.1 type I 3-dehydroquinate dehydratase [Ignisphaera sp. 4213-co]